MQSHGVPRSVRPFQGKPPGFGRYPQPEGAIFRLGSRDLPDVLLHSRADTVVRRKVQIGNWCHRPCSTLAGRATQCVHYSEFVSDMNLCPQRLDKLTAPTQAFPAAMLQAQYCFTTGMLRRNPLNDACRRGGLQMLKNIDPDQNAIRNNRTSQDVSPMISRQAVCKLKEARIGRIAFPQMRIHGV